MGYILRSRIARTYGDILFNCVRNYQTFPRQSGGTVSRAHTVHGVPGPLRLHRHLLPPVLLVTAILVGVKRYLVVVSICISLMANDVEHLFLVLIGHLCIFFGEISIYVLCPFFNWVVIVDSKDLRVYFGY